MKPHDFGARHLNGDGASSQPGTPEPGGGAEERRDSGVFMGTFRGIRFYLDYSWFFIFGIVIYALAASAFPTMLEGRSRGVYLAIGLAAAFLFFFSIVLHELGHSVVSQRNGIPVTRITLLFIGGVAEISREPDDAWTELKIALAGPAVTLVLVALYEALAWGFVQARFWEAALVFRWLATVNLALAIFNAIPGYPLDGGRVLRALLWMRNGQFRQATYIASRAGIFFSWALMALGVLGLFNGLWNSVLFILVGMFLKEAAETGYSQALYREALQGALVRDLMTRNPVSIPSRLPLSLAVDDYFLTNHHVAFPVVDDDGTFRGVLRLEYLKAVPRERWPYTTAAEVAEQHQSRNLQIAAEASAAVALRMLLVTGQGRLAAINDAGKVEGMITRHDLLHFIEIHTELAGDRNGGR